MVEILGRTEDEWLRIYPDLVSMATENEPLTDNAEFVRALKNRIAEKHREAGVRIIDPENTYIDDRTKIGSGTVIHPYCFLRGSCDIGCDVILYPFNDIEDTEIGNGADVRSSFIVGAKIGAKTTVGPFATLRRGAEIGKGCRVGDYVEIKKATLADGVKVAHLAYIGDAEVGANTNVGCGTVFANYNGKIKQRTVVGKNAFLGANTNLVAPLKIGDGAYIAAGSTVTDDVPTELLCIARSRQVFKVKK